MKLVLTVALQLLSENQKRGYAALNAVRNRMAHSVDVELLPTDESRIYKALSEDQRKSADFNLEKNFSKASTLPRLKASILALCVEALLAPAAKQGEKAKREREKNEPE